MPKPKLFELVLKVLKDAKVELPNEAQSILETALGSDSLQQAGLVELPDGHKVVEEKAYVRVHDDNKQLRKRAQDAEAERDTFKTDLDKFKPLAETMLKRAEQDWTTRSERIPVEKAEMKDDEKARIKVLRSSFVFAEKDKPLTNDQVLANIAKFDEYEKLGVFGLSNGNGTTTRTTQVTADVRTGAGTGAEQKTSEQVWDDFYKSTDPRRPQQNAR